MMMVKVWFLGHNMSVGACELSCSLGISCPYCLSGVSWLLGDRVMLCNLLSPAHLSGSSSFV